MAYFMWDNDGVMDLVTETEPDLLRYFELLPDLVEKADVFRIVVCNSIGGLVRSFMHCRIHNELIGGTCNTVGAFQC
jgi:hypothetical protein